MTTADERPPLEGHKALITISAMLGGLMAFLDISIVNVGLNDIRAAFGTPLDQIAWISTAYAMANITIIPMSGWLLRRFGFRRYFAASLLFFTLASGLCGIAWNLQSLVIFRILQGLGGGAIIPTSQSVLLSRYPLREHGTAAAFFALAAITGPLLGPTLGGYLIEALSWHYIFFVNVPFGLVAAYLAWRHIEQPQFTADRSPIDRAGIALLAVGMGSLQYVLEDGNREGWFESSIITVLALVAVISLVGFISHELETEHPIVELRVFSNVPYSAATALNFLIGTAIFGGSVLLSLFCGSIMHYRAVDIGELFFRGFWIQIFLLPLVGKLVMKADPRLFLVPSVVLVSASLWLNAHLTPQADMGAVVTPLILRAIGTSLGFVPLTLLAVSSLPQALQPGGTAIFNVTRELGASVGTAWMVNHLEHARKANYVALTSHVDAMSEAAREQLRKLQAGPGARLDHPVESAMALLRLRIENQALVRAFNGSFFLLSLAFASAGLLILCMRRTEAQQPVDTSNLH